MRIRRLAPLASLTVLLAGCAVEGTDVSTQAAPQEQDGLFVGRDDQARKLAADIGIQKITAERPEMFRGAGELKVERVHIDEFGEAHDRIGQTIDGVPVFGADAIVHLDSRGSIRSVTDYLARDLRVETKPEISADEALKIAYAAVDGVVTGKIASDLQILPRRQLGAVLTYRVQLDATTNEGDPAMPVVFVDAKTGEVVEQFDNLQWAKNRNTYNGNTLSSLPGTLVRTEGSAASGDAVLDAAHNGAGITYDFFFSKYGRDSYNGAGAQIRSTVHHQKNYVNAFWNGTQMVYGDGDGVNSSALTVLDVVAHELTHAITSSSSNLVYQNESGALNEAMSDVFGAAVEAYRDGAVSGNTWKIGEECWTPATAGDALRYMNTPNLAGDYDYYPERYVGASDNGGVHWNSGIANLAFYLAVMGGTHPRGKTTNVVPALSSNAMTSIEMGAAIFYRANTACLGSSSNFAAARTCTVDAATFLYGAAAATSISEAWTAVGVGGSGGGGGGGTYTQIGVVNNISVGSKKWSTTTWTQATPAGATKLKIEISGGAGDADLYVRFGSAPTSASYTCRPYLQGNNEVCEFIPPQNGTYYIRLYGFAASSGITLKTSSAQ